MSTHGYIIYREGPTGDSFDPTAPLQFFPSKDSDELFFALKTAYPTVSTHSERMRNAVIDFLMNERDVESITSYCPPPLPTMQSSASFPSTSGSPQSSCWQSGSSGCTSSPEILDRASPPYATSSSASVPSLSRTASVAQASPADLNQMTSVFSLTSNVQPKLRVRRKMTDAEKVEYRKRRVVKACEKCSKRKRKCHHMQAQMQNLSRSSAAASPMAPKASLSDRRASKAAIRPDDSVPSSATSGTGSNQDLLPAPPPELGSQQYDLLGLDDFLDFDTLANQYDSFPWSRNEDWTLLDWTLPDTTEDASIYQSSPNSSSQQRDVPSSAIAQESFQPLALPRAPGSISLNIRPSEMLLSRGSEANMTESSGFENLQTLVQSEGLNDPSPAGLRPTTALTRPRGTRPAITKLGPATATTSLAQVPVPVDNANRQAAESGLLQVIPSGSRSLDGAIFSKSQGPVQTSSLVQTASPVQMSSPVQTAGPVNREALARPEVAGHAGSLARPEILGSSGSFARTESLGNPGGLARPEIIGNSGGLASSSTLDNKSAATALMQQLLSLATQIQNASISAVIDLSRQKPMEESRGQDLNLLLSRLVIC